MTRTALPDNVTSYREFTTQRYHKLVTTFVQIYLTRGASAASSWIAHQKISPEDYPSVKDIINKEFKKKGYAVQFGESTRGATKPEGDK